MGAAGSETLMTVLGFSREAGRAYERVQPYAGQRVDAVAEALGIGAEQLRRDLRELTAHGIVREAAGDLEVLTPLEAVGRLLSDVIDSSRLSHGRLVELSRALPYLAGSSAKVPRPIAGDEQPLDGELIPQANVSEVVQTLARRGRGDLAWLRPRLFDIPYEGQLVELVGEAVSQGRRCRGIYAASLVREAPMAMAARVDAGEEVRTLPALSTRMLVVGTTHALLSEPLGVEEPARMVVRQRGLVELASLLFDLMWERAIPLSELEDGGTGQRRFLVEQLAAGVQDELIARRLGVSLRTVRRRVAEVMTELDAESRFQAGVEAARRGWV